MEGSDRITHDPHAMGGHACIRGMCVPNGKVTKTLNELYSKEPSKLDEGVAQMQWLSLPRED